MSLTKHYAPLMIPLVLHDEPSQPEFHCYPAAEVDAALDQAQRERQQLIANHERREDEMEAEIARLSSPPQERGEILHRRRCLDGLDGIGTVTAQGVREDIDTLLGDCAAWRNAHALVTAERDQLKAAKLQHDTQQRAAALALHDERIERLEGALRELYSRFSHGRGSLYVWASRICMGALAAADGQQKCGDGCPGCTQCFKPLEDSDRPAPRATGDGTFLGMKVVVDPSMPADQMEIRSGRNSVRVTNLGTGDGVEGE